MSLNEFLSVWVGKGNIWIVAIASKMIQSADFTDITFFSSQISGLSQHTQRILCIFKRQHMFKRGFFEGVH